MKTSPLTQLTNLLNAQQLSVAVVPQGNLGRVQRLSLVAGDYYDEIVVLPSGEDLYAFVARKYPNYSISQVIPSPGFYEVDLQSGGFKATTTAPVYAGFAPSR